MKEYLKIFFKGFAVGLANIIPGVSGGTMALIMGVYERCLAAISAINLETFKKLIGLCGIDQVKRKVAKDELRRIDVTFLLVLACGAMGAIFALAKLMTIMLTSFHDPTYGFFFGLVLASVLVPWKMIKKITLPVILMTVIGAGLGVGSDFLLSKESKISNAESKIMVSQLKEQQKALTIAGNDQALAKIEAQLVAMSKEDGSIFYYLKLVGAGAVAISAMILPGISGSFLLLAMGLYFDILAAISTLNLLVITLFGLGCIIGLLLFSHFLNWLLKHAANSTMGFLTGLMAGSLWAIWPFKEIYTAGIGTDYVQNVYLNNIWPRSFSGNEICTCITLLLGVVLVGGFIYYEAKHQKVEG